MPATPPHDAHSPRTAFAHGEGWPHEPVRPHIPRDRNEAMLVLSETRRVRLTNLGMPFWPALGITKAALIQYYLDVAPLLLPHLAGRAMVMKRYPNGVAGKFFVMKRAPTPRPSWVETCAIEQASGGGVSDFPVVNDAAALAWIVNLGCIDLHPWYARCDEVHRPDYLHFDLDPGHADFERVREAGLVVHEALTALHMPSYVKTSGSRGLHVYVPIVRGPDQNQVSELTRSLARSLEGQHPRLVTAEVRVASRSAERVLIDYKQNAWGRTLASVYSLRPTPRATVSAPITWSELEAGVMIDDFRIDTMPSRLKALGDLWSAVAPDEGGRFDLGSLL